MLNFIRWLLVIPAAIGGWCLAIVLGIVVHSALEGVCLVNSGDPNILPRCGPWLMPASMTLALSLAALFVVAFTSLIAPSNRGTVAWIAYLCGTAVALSIFLQNQDEYALPFAASVIVGFIATVYIQSRKPKSRYGELHLPR